MLTASEKTGGYELIPEGVYIATCVWVIDMGLQWSDFYKKSSQKVLITWEIPEITMDVDGVQKPKLISKEYSLSLNEKATLRAHLEAWRGRKFTEAELQGFALQNLIGKSCQLQIIHNNDYANVASIMALPKGTPQRMPTNDTVLLDLDASVQEVENTLDKLPVWVVNRVRQSESYSKLYEKNIDTTDSFTEVTESEDLPF